MYLKSIKAVGFKSFADKTIVDFNKDITAVVGPNGSGKSNIVDAIRWVLGEQSVKQLRGATIMSDVIFSGSSTRDGQKKASVTLTFDNKDHYLKSEFDELEIRREVYKTGENDYFINNARVRLKDVKDLFLDSGAGSGAFNIISQGNITEIVNSKPNDRRIIFESAAGVLKYKNRKEEAIKKLDKTKDNLVSIKLVIDELDKTVKPLKKQSENAKKFNKLNEESKNIEIALLSEDITEYNKSLVEYNQELNHLNSDIKDYSLDKDLSDIEVLKLENIKLDEVLSDINVKLININDEIAKLSSEKQITIERQRFSNKKIDINDALVKLKEEEGVLLKYKETLKNEYETLSEEKSVLSKKLNDLSNSLITTKIKRSNLSADLENQNKSIIYLQNKIEITKNNLLNGEFYPKAVRSVINNISLAGIIDTIGNLISCDEEYNMALTTSLGASANYIVTKDFESAKNAINYLKNNRLGKATFYPMDTIKSRSINKNDIDLLSKEKDFIGVLSELIKYDNKYKNIIENQTGNVLIAKNLDSLNKIGKIIGYKYKVVSLDGSVLYSGGALQGGANENYNVNKNNLKTLERELESEKRKLDNISLSYDKVCKEYNNNDEMIDLLSKKNILLNESIGNKKNNLDECNYNLENKTLEIKGINNVAGNKLEEELINLIETLTKKAQEKISLELNFKNFKDKKNDLFDQINTLENSYKNKQSEINKANLLIKNKEIEIGKIEVKLENLLFTLSETYSLTYELARETYFLDMDKNDARVKLGKLKREIDSLGIINLGSIEQYETLSERYNFLKSQEEDLEVASENLLSIIGEMDEIMITKFKKSFDEVSKQFKSVFKEIFQGGKGELLLSNPDDILNTGIEIVAEPPGKKLNNTIALSGGEKSLTAICLMFSILNVRPVPFIILDEAEAALDEANVDMFGKYINDRKNESQFILITHKKRMMEYADLLYGITMQESGVSKIVSTKLEV